MGVEGPFPVVVGRASRLAINPSSSRESRRAKSSSTFSKKEFEKYDSQEIEESDWLPLLSLNLIQRSSLEQFHYRDYGSERHEPMDEMRWRQRYFFTDIGGCLLNNFEKLLPKK